MNTNKIIFKSNGVEFTDEEVKLTSKEARKEPCSIHEFMRGYASCCVAMFNRINNECLNHLDSDLSDMEKEQILICKTAEQCIPYMDEKYDSTLLSEISKMKELCSRF